ASRARRQVALCHRRRRAERRLRHDPRRTPRRRRVAARRRHPPAPARRAVALGARCRRLRRSDRRCGRRWNDLTAAVGGHDPPRLNLARRGSIVRAMRKLIPLVALLGVTAAARASEPRKVVSIEGITEYALDNGLRVLLFPDSSKPTVTVNVTYLVGSRHEGYGESGMAHLLEHMLFKGTPTHQKIWTEMDAHGAQFNGTTDYDRTNYFETVNATDENLKWALGLEADRMVNSKVAADDLKSEFSVVRNEFEIGENSPQSILEERIYSTAYLWHNYGKSVIGSRSDIERVPIA